MDTLVEIYNRLKQKLFFMHFYSCFSSFLIDFEIKTNLYDSLNVLLGKN